MQHPIRAIGAWTVAMLAVLVAVPALLPGTATAQGTTSVSGISPRLLADASWHGRPIQRPVPRATPVADRSPGLARGTGYRTSGGSRRVRALQRRLTRLGYRPGTSDGLFGPRTQAAVVAFQRKHGLEQDGSAGSETLALVRRRTAPGTTAGDAPPSAAPPPAPSPAPPLVPVAAPGDGGLPLAPILLAVFAVAVLAVALRRRSTSWEVGAPPVATAAPPVEPVIADEEPRISPAPRIRHHGPPWERRAALRERILAMKADGMSLQAIADQLTAEGEPTLGGARRWQPWSVQAATRATAPVRRPAAHGRRNTP